MPNITVTSFAQAERAFASAKDKSKGKPISTSTRVVQRGEDYAVRYHETDVVTYKADGSIVLNTGGWLTMTTKERMTEHLPAGYRVASVKGRWFLMTYDSTPIGPDTFAWRDGITITPSGSVTGFERIDLVAEQDAENKRIDKAVKAYVEAITPVVIREAHEHAGGDCFGCLAPDAFDVSHLALHMEEGYYPFRLLVNAVADKGYPSPMVILGQASSAPSSEWALRTVRKIVAGYLRNALYSGAVAVAHGRKPVGASKRVWQASA